MPRQRFQTEEMIQKLRKAEVLLSQGLNVAEACRPIGVTDNTYYCRRKESMRTCLHRTASSWQISGDWGAGPGRPADIF